MSVWLHEYVDCANCTCSHYLNAACRMLLGVLAKRRSSALRFPAPEFWLRHLLSLCCLLPSRALFEAQVTYTTPRIIGSKRRKGILVINGAEMAIIRLRETSSSSTGRDTDATEATVLVAYQLSKVSRISHSVD